LTGLSATQATPTLPSGATAMHMLADPDVTWPILPHSIALAVQERARYISSLPISSFSTTKAHRPAGAHARLRRGKALPEAGKHWYSVRASPYDWRKLLLFRRPLNGDNNPLDNALWYSDDFGDTWTNIWTDLANGSNFDWRQSFVEWSASVEGEWISNRINSGSKLIRGLNATYAEFSIGSGGEATAMPGLGGDAWFEREDGTGVYADAANATTTTGATGYAYGWGDTLRGTTQAAHVNLGIGLGNVVYVSNDYRTGGWSSIPSSGGTHSLAVLTGGTIVVGNGANIDTIAGAWTSPVITQTSFSVGDTITAASSDNQTQTVAAVLRNGINGAGSSTAQPVVRDAETGVWALIPRPSDATDLANAIEPVIRTT
jgi:hypothetical protein